MNPISKREHESKESAFVEYTEHVVGTELSQSSGKVRLQWQCKQCDYKSQIAKDTKSDIMNLLRQSHRHRNKTGHGLKLVYL